MMIAGGYLCGLREQSEYKKQVKMAEDISSAVLTQQKESGGQQILPQEINSDFAALLQFESGLISLPVVQTADNSFYLNHAFDGSLSEAGTLFFDMQTRRDDMIRLIYGHTVFGSGDLMFTTLHRLLNEEAFHENRIFRLYYPDCVETYEINMAALADPGSGIFETRIRSLDSREFEIWKKCAEEAAVIRADEELKADDRIVILQTCIAENSPLRLCIIAKQILCERID